MKKIILNAIGCPESGARLILENLLKSTPRNIKVLAFVPKVNRYDRYDFCPGNVKCILLNVKYWSLFLRPVLEIIVNLLKALFNYDGIINISNHGLCFTRNQVLYIQNQYILDLEAEKRLGGGYPNFITRFGLNTFLKRASAVCVQTQHMKDLLLEYCRRISIGPPKNVIIVSPLPFTDLQVVLEGGKKYEFQFFYPASDFPHKRIKLAIDSMIEYNKLNPSAGLIITAQCQGESVPFIDCLGQIPHNEVLKKMHESDAMLYTSEREALGIPLLEAQYFEKPAVLPELPYASEIYGEAGVYFHNPDTESIVRSMDHLYKNYIEYCAKVKLRKKEQWASRKSWEEHWNIFIQNTG